MCEPITIAAGIAIIAGAVITAAAQRQQGKIAEQVGNYNKAVAENNAELSRRAGRDAIARGDIEAASRATKQKGAVAAARAAAASRGVTANTGSALDVQGDINVAGTLDQKIARNNAKREALGYAAQANDFTQRGQLAQFQGQAANAASKLQAAGTVISSVGGVASKWYGRAA